MRRAAKGSGVADNAGMARAGSSFVAALVAIASVTGNAAVAQTPVPAVVPQKGSAPQKGGKPVPTTNDSPAQERDVVVLNAYDEASSRLAFASVDRNADDRIDIFEFVQALDEAAASTPRETAAFRLLDKNDRDGFLNWPEFDQRVREALRLTGKFRYYPARVLPGTGPSIGSEDAKALLDARTESLLTLLDADLSGTVSRDEFATLLTVAGMPAANMVKFVEADADSDGQLDRKQLAKLIGLLPNLPRSPPVLPSSKSFGILWRLADTDGDGEVSIAELEAVLRKHQIHLGRWADKIVTDADRSGDRRLGPAEVLAAEPRK